MLNVAANLRTYLVEIIIRHNLRHFSTVKIVGVYFHDIQITLLQIAKQKYQLIVGARLADSRVQYAAGNVQLYYPKHLRIGNQRDRFVNILEKIDSSVFLRFSKVGQLQLVLVQFVVLNRLYNVANQTKVA